VLRTHGRYAYSNITRRPDFSWPGGKRLAVYMAVNIEQFSYGEGKGAAITLAITLTTLLVMSTLAVGPDLS
jgi:hypothetical protein